MDTRHRRNDRATYSNDRRRWFSVWSRVNGAQHSPSRVKSGPGAACYASRWDVAPGGPDRARSCHWPPLTPPHTTHCSTCPPCRRVPRVTSTRMDSTRKVSIFERIYAESIRSIERASVAWLKSITPLSWGWIQEPKSSKIYRVTYEYNLEF